MSKSFSSFILAFLIAAVVICYMAISAARPAYFENFLSFRDEKIIFLGKSYTPDENIIYAVDSYLSACEKTHDAIIPQFVSHHIKRAATAIITAAANTVSGFNGTVKNILFGYM